MQFQDSFLTIGISWDEIVTDEPAKSWRHRFFRLKKQKRKLTSPGIKNGDIKLSELIPLSTARAKSRNGVKGRSALADAVLRRSVALPNVCPRKKRSLIKK